MLLNIKYVCFESIEKVTTEKQETILFFLDADFFGSSFQRLHLLTSTSCRKAFDPLIKSFYSQKKNSLVAFGLSGSTKIGIIRQTKICRQKKKIACRGKAIELPRHLHIRRSKYTCIYTLL
ncbi:MAG: hypothetical protein J1D86_08280 [Alistipes sp.]|nr:hypothetical protein [Alistipes sp.]